jgi:hypothetical protein
MCTYLTSIHRHQKTIFFDVHLEDTLYTIKENQYQSEKISILDFSQDKIWSFNYRKIMIFYPCCRFFWNES